MPGKLIINFFCLITGELPITEFLCIICNIEHCIVHYYKIKILICAIFQMLPVSFHSYFILFNILHIKMADLFRENIVI